MDNTLLNPIEDSIKLIYKAMHIGKKQITRIRLKDIIKLPELQSISREVKSTYITLYLEGYWKLVNIVLDEIVRGDQKTLTYFTPLIRIMIEIYSKLLHLLNIAESECIKLMIADHLFSFAQYLSISSNKSEKDYYRKEDIKYRKDLENLIEKNNYNFPTIDKFTKSQRVKLGLTFPKVKISLINNLNGYQLKYSDLNVTGEILYQQYVIYSDYIHGNILAHIGERYVSKNHTIGMTLIVNRLVLELIDDHFLNGSHIDEIKKLNVEINKLNFADFAIFMANLELQK